jgi:hypothetical protein
MTERSVEAASLSIDEPALEDTTAWVLRWRAEVSRELVRSLRAVHYRKSESVSFLSLGWNAPCPARPPTFFRQVRQAAAIEGVLSGFF